jgi:DeoR/GlpR family transcriptional regulator of sugar metabolism
MTTNENSAPPKIFREERLKLITERILADGKVYVNELAEEFNVSSSSIRTDLSELEAWGILKRTHGGAIMSEALDSRLVTEKSPLEARAKLLQSEKETIGRATAALVADGDALMIDGGSTTVYVARYLGSKRSLTVVTNAVTLLPELVAIPDVQIYVTGGALNRRFATLLGEMTLDTIGRFRTARAILGMDGISVDGGLSVTDPAVAATKRKMMAASEQLIVVADHTKLSRVSLYSIAPLEAMDVLVTDGGVDSDTVEAIRACGPQVIVAS